MNQKIPEQFEENNIIVSGVELWNQKGDFPVWLASSNFDPTDAKKAAEGAKAFITKFGNDKKALFNFTW